MGCRAPRRCSRHRTAGLLAALLLLVFAAGCLPLPPSPPPPLPTQECIASAPARAADYQRLFDLRSTEAAAADVWSPTALGNGQVAWFLGDTLVGRQAPAGTLAPGYRMIHNAGDLENAACLDVLMRGAVGSRSELLPSLGDGSWYWPAGTYVDGTVLNVFLLLVRPYDRPGQLFDWYLAGIRVARLSIPSLTLLDVSRPTPIADVTSAQTFRPYGNWVASDADHVYLYGATGASNYVARASRASVMSGPWEYWDGSGWSASTPDAAAPMQFGGSPPLSQLRVTPYGTGWLGVAKSIDAFSSDVTAWYSTSPSGPWSLVPTPDGTGQIATATVPAHDLNYGAALEQLPGAGWTVMWNVNAGDLDTIAADVRRYGPKFVAPQDLPTPDALFPVTP